MEVSPNLKWHQSDVVRLISSLIPAPFREVPFPSPVFHFFIGPASVTERRTLEFFKY